MQEWNKTINLAVKRHINRFPERFMFQLNDVESELLWFQVETKNGKVETRGGKYNRPYVFTEQGVAMLSAVLRTTVAEEMSVKIMDAFVAMRHYIGNNFMRLDQLKTLVLDDHDRLIKTIDDVKLIQQALDQFASKQKDEGIYFDGHIYDAYSRILEIFSEAKESLTVIDAYTDIITLNIIKRLNIPVTIITSKSAPLKSQDIKKYQEQYSNLTIIYDNTFHDRYFILDNKTVYHCGASINRIGYKTFSIAKINDEEIVTALLSKINLE